MYPINVENVVSDFIRTYYVRKGGLLIEASGSRKAGVDITMTRKKVSASIHVSGPKIELALFGGLGTELFQLAAKELYVKWKQKKKATT